MAAARSAGARAVGGAGGSHPAHKPLVAGADTVLADLTDTAGVLRVLLG